MASSAGGGGGAAAQGSVGSSSSSSSNPEVSLFDCKAASIKFDLSYAPGRVRLFQLDDAITDALRVGDTVTFKGGPTEDVVLCTEEATYAVRRVETSNMCLLTHATAPAAPLSAVGAGTGIPSSQTSAPAGSPDTHTGASATSKPVFAVTESVACHHEVAQIAPRVHRVRELLFQVPYDEREAARALKAADGGGDSDDDEEDEDDDDGTGPRQQDEVDARRRMMCTWDHLSAHVQASDAELRQALTDIGAFEHDGYWRVLDTAYADKVYDFVMGDLDENGWSLAAVPMQECITNMTEFPSHIVEHIFRLHGTPHMDNKDYYSLSPELVARSRALRLLRVSRSKTFEVRAFLEAWHSALPNKAVEDIATLDLLKGDILLERCGAGMGVELYRAEDLSHEPAKRFQELFARRARWRLDDLEPFIKDLVGGPVKLPDLLLTYTRSTLQSDGTRIFSAR